MQELAEAAGITVEERNFQRAALDEAEVREIIEHAGGIAAVISTRNKAVKEAGWAATPPGLDTYVAAVARDNKMIRRPILLLGAHVVVGNDAAGPTCHLHVPSSVVRHR